MRAGAQVRRMAVVGVAAGLVLSLSAGSCQRRGTRDAPIDADLQDNQAPFIVNMPDGYMNLALKCVGPDLIVAHTRAAAPVVVAGSENCAEGRAEALGIPRVGTR